VPTRSDAVALFTLTGFAAAWTCAKTSAQDPSVAATLSATGRLRTVLIAPIRSW
jgi:hypothetical protein